MLCLYGTRELASETSESGTSACSSPLCEPAEFSRAQPHLNLTSSGSSRSVYFSSPVRDSITSLIQSSKEFSFLTSIRQKRQNSGTIFAFSYGQYQTNR